ncbi:MAG: helix-turn-helix transcriptional regulator [Clostridia bacterium]|nr:helix-turn-helix transcriptional regulator [Clostridia bacterium]
MNIDYKLIGERIKRVRKMRGLTQEVMAEKLNVSIGYVSQVERGITKISLDLLGAISSILDYDIAYFVSESAVNSGDYMESELLEEIRRLDEKKRKYILKVIKLTNETL